MNNEIKNHILTVIVKDGDKILRDYTICRHCGGPNSNVFLRGANYNIISPSDIKDFWSIYKYFCFECLQVEYLVPGTLEI